jgi:hypothetical protein
MSKINRNLLQRSLAQRNWSSTRRWARKASHEKSYISHGIACARQRVFTPRYRRQWVTLAVFDCRCICGRAEKSRRVVNDLDDDDGALFGKRWKRAP